MPSSQICVPQVLYFCFMQYVRPEKLNKRSTRVASLVRNSLPQYSELPAFSYAAELGSHSWSTAIKYNRDLSLKEQQNLLIRTKELHLTRGWGDVMSIKLHTEICTHRAMSLCIWVACSYTCIWGQRWTKVQIIQSFQLPPFCKQLSIMVYIPLQGDICNVVFSFQEPLTAGLRLYPHNHVSNCQQEAILKSHLSKILCTYSSEDNTLPASRERSLATTFKIGQF